MATPLGEILYPFYIGPAALWGEIGYSLEIGPATLCGDIRYPFDIGAAAPLGEISAWKSGQVTRKKPRLDRTRIGLGPQILRTD